MRLLRAELARLFARRFTRVMLLALVLALGVVAAVTAAATHQPGPADLVRAEREAAAARAECERAEQEAPAPPPPGAGDPAEFPCDGIDASAFLPFVLDFRDEMPDMLLTYVALLVLFGYLVGASFVGAEWPSGGVTNLLLWRTERTRVLFGKLTALLLGILTVGVLGGAGWVGTIWTIARYRGRLGELTEGFWISLGLDGLRGLTVALCAALAGAALAWLGRRTAAALGCLIGYLVVWEIGGRVVMGALRVPGDRYMGSTYLWALLTKRVTVFGGCDGWDDCRSLVVTWPWGLAVVGGITLLLVLFAAWSFRRRDVA